MEGKCWPHKRQWDQIRFHYLLWGGSAKSQEVPELFQLKVGSSPSRNLHWSCHHKELLKLITSTLRFKVKSCKRSGVPTISHTEPFSKKKYEFFFIFFLSWRYYGKWTFIHTVFAKLQKYFTNVTVCMPHTLLASPSFDESFLIVKEVKSRKVF